MKARRIFAVLAGAWLAAWIAVLGAKRAALLARSDGRAPRDAVNESRFSAFADRDPPLVSRLEAAGRSIASGEAVLPVCAPECETSWFSVMAGYALPRQAVVPAKTQGQLGSIFPTRLVRTREAVRLEPRSERDGGR